MAFLNLNPETFTAGSLFSEGDGVITAARFHMLEYRNGAAEPAPALEITIKTGDDEHVQSYTVGNADKFRPSLDGTAIEAVVPGISINRNSNIGIFIKSLVDAGFDASKLNDGKASAFVGINAHFVRRAFGKNNTTGKDKEILVVDRLLAAPAPSAANTGNTAPAGNSADAVKDFVIDTINEVIANNGGSLPVGKVLVTFMTATKGNPMHKDGLKLVMDKSFIAANFVNNDGNLEIKA